MVVGRFRSMHRLWLLVLVCALLEFGGTTPSTFAAENLRVWVRTNNVDLFKAIAAEYIKENEGVEIEVTPDGGAVEKLTVAVLGGVAPDLVEIGGTQAPMLALDGLIQPITRFAEQDGLSVKDFWPATYYRGWFEGELYSLPVNADANFIFVWYKRMFEEAGLDGETPPRFISDLDEYNRRLSQRDPAGRLVRIGIVPWYQYREANSALTWAWAFGGGFFDEERWAVTATHPNNLAMFEWMLGLAQQYPPSEVDPLRGSEYMHIWNKTAAMSLMVGDQIFTLRLTHPDELIGIGAMPYHPETGPEHPEWVGGWNMAIPVNARNAERAWDFMRFALASPMGTSIQYPAASGHTAVWYPGYRKAPLYQQYLETGDILHVVAQNLLANAQFFPPRLTVPLDLARTVRDVVEQRMAPMAALERLQAETEQRLAEDMARRRAQQSE